MGGEADVVLGIEVFDEVLSKGSEVDVGASLDAGSGDDVVVVTAF